MIEEPSIERKEQNPAFKDIIFRLEDHQKRQEWYRLYNNNYTYHRVTLSPTKIQPREQFSVEEFADERNAILGTDKIDIEAIISRQSLTHNQN